MRRRVARPADRHLNRANLTLGVRRELRSSLNPNRHRQSRRIVRDRLNQAASLPVRQPERGPICDSGVEDVFPQQTLLLSGAKDRVQIREIFAERLPALLMMA